MSDTLTSIDIPIDGEPARTLTIRLRERSGGTPTYQARRIVPAELRSNPRNPYATKSLGTTELDEAIRHARTWERKLFTRIDAGEPVAELPFDKTARQFMTWALKRTRSADDKGEPLYTRSAFIREQTCIERYLIPFFKNTDLRKINTRMVERYVEWRRDYYIEGPGSKEDFISFNRNGLEMKRPSKLNSRPAPSTINKDAVAYSKVLKHAMKTANLAISDIPRITISKDRKQVHRRRARFSDESWSLLEKSAVERAMYGPNRKAEYHRFVLWGFITLLRGTGVRVSEARWLRVKHLKLVPVKDEARSEYAPVEEPFETWNGNHPDVEVMRDPDGQILEFRIQVAKDNPGLKQASHARTVIPTLDLSFAMYHYLAFLAHNVHKAGLCQTEDWKSLDTNQFLFIHQSGARIESQKTSFTNLLKASVSENFPHGLHEVDGERMSLSCIRHTYASKQIEAGATRNGLGLLANNLGTSPEMIRRHYGQELHELRADDLQLG